MWKYEEAAGSAHDLAAIALRGTDAVLNVRPRARPCCVQTGSLARWSGSTEFALANLYLILLHTGASCIQNPQHDLTYIACPQCSVPSLSPP